MLYHLQCVQSPASAQVHTCMCRWSCAPMCVFDADYNLVVDHLLRILRPGGSLWIGYEGNGLPGDTVTRHVICTCMAMLSLFLNACMDACGSVFLTHYASGRSCMHTCMCKGGNIYASAHLKCVRLACLRLYALECALPHLSRTVSLFTSVQDCVSIHICPGYIGQQCARAKGNCMYACMCTAWALAGH